MKRQEVKSKPLTLKDVRDAVPKHCFERSTLRSLSHLVLDLLVMLGLALLVPFLPSFVLPIYWLVQGSVCTGLWVLAHEMGHGSFSDSRLLNNVLGFFLHSFLLVPFFSWKYTHSRHHKGCGHLERDQVFVPEISDGETVIKEAPIVVVTQLIIMLVFGWPMYLINNTSGQKYSKFASHFLPHSPIFEKTESPFVMLSNLGLASMMAILVYCCQVFGTLTVVNYYFLPYLVVNFWLVVITYLQHTDVKLPHYSAEKWDFLNGALATVDRDFGFLNHVFHHMYNGLIQYRHACCAPSFFANAFLSCAGSYRSS
jgi:omega-6 fatty acid desaturase (delta-12 desaturase)